MFKSQQNIFTLTIIHSIPSLCIYKQKKKELTPNHYSYVWLHLYFCIGKMFQQEPETIFYIKFYVQTAYRVGALSEYEMYKYETNKK